MSEHEQRSEPGQQLRMDSVRAAAAAGSGHPTSSMSTADLIAMLLAKYSRYDFDRLAEPLNDHLIFSKVTRRRCSTRSVRPRVRFRTPAAVVPETREPARGSPDAWLGAARAEGSGDGQRFNQSRRDAQIALGAFTRLGGRFP